MVGGRLGVSGYDKRLKRWNRLKINIFDNAIWNARKHAIAARVAVRQGRAHKRAILRKLNVLQTKNVHA